MSKKISFENVFKSTNLKRFVDKLNIGQNGCIEWLASLDAGGYGVFSVKTDNGEYTAYKAHRYALELSLGSLLPSDIFACHRCDNPKCVCPDHLFAGSNRDNVDDMLSKGRQRRKLSDEQVRLLRDDIVSGNFTISELSKKYDVSRTNVRCVRDRKTYKNI